MPLSTGLAVRLACRSRALNRSTAGDAPGYVQGNLAILPKELAADFLRFCQQNPKPCPVIGVSEVGDPGIPALGLDLDIRTDLPGYRVWMNGDLVDETTDVSALVARRSRVIRARMLTLLRAGADRRRAPNAAHGSGVTVPMYRTDIACVPAGPFWGPMVVSMRPFTPAHAIRAIQITSKFPAVHGAPIHIGLPELIGIQDLLNPTTEIASSCGPMSYPSSGHAV